MLTQSELKEFLSYDPEIGIFTWLKAIGKRVRVGSVAGTYRKGYIRIGLARKQYSAHRLAFLFMTGLFPPEEVDHINGIKADNRRLNLRQATRNQNMCNQSKRSDNTSGFKGIGWDKVAKKWEASIKHMNQHIYLGLFTTPEAAHQAYIAAAEKLHGNFANLESEETKWMRMYLVRLMSRNISRLKEQHNGK